MGVADTARLQTSGHAGDEFVAALFRRHRKGLLWYLKNLVPCPHEAEDVAQEAYLRLLKVAHLDEDLVRARNYLFKTATNIALDGHRRRLSRKANLHVAVDSIEVAAEGPDLERIFDVERCASVLRRVLLDVLPRTRTAFLLYWHAEMTYLQIAAELGVSKKKIERDTSLTLAVCRSRIEERHVV
jgi:RNA polymerase sigma factor (sigma-70 family)